MIPAAKKAGLDTIFLLAPTSTEERVRLDDVQRLLPEAGAARQKNEANTVAVGQLRTFDLASEDDELLAEQGVLCDQIRPAACGV